MSGVPVPLVTALYAAVLALLLLAVAVPIVLLRRKHRVGLGDGGNKELARAIRVHGNLVEWGVPAILLLLLAELTGAPLWLLHGCGLGLVVARVAHATGLYSSAGHSTRRFAGTGLTWTIVVVLAGWNLYAGLRGSFY